MQLTPLLRLQLKRDRRGALSSIFGIVVGVTSLLFFVALGLGVGRVVREKVFPLDTRLVEVIPPQVSLGPFASRLDADTVERLAGLPQVSHAWRKMAVRVPAVSFYDGNFFGRRLRMGLEVLAVGVDPDFVAADVKADDFRDRGAGQPIPVVVSSRLLEIYDKSFAPARSLPQLSPQMILGFKFPIDWNRSFVGAPTSGQFTSTQAEVAGVSDRGLLAGVTIPLEVARRLNAEAKVDAETYSGVALLAADPSAVPALIAAVKDMGLAIDDQERRLSQSAGAAVGLTTSALALLSLLICVLAAFNIAHALSASVRARERDLAVMRAVGARRRDVFRLVMAEASLLGLLGGALGALAAFLFSLALDAAAARWLPPFPFQPDTFFSWPAWLPLLGVGLGVLAAVVGAVLPARRAASVDPARVLAGQGG